MRDITIQAELHRMNEASGRRAAMLLGQYEVVMTWQQAVESLLKVSSVWDRIKWLYNPAHFVEVVQSIQINLIEQHRKDLAEAAKKPKIEVVHSA